MQPDRRLSRSRTALDRQQLVERGPDDLVLLGLDGGHDVEHFARTRPFELGQQRIAATKAGPRQLFVRVAEKIVGYGDDPAAIDHHLATELQPQCVFDPGPVKRVETGARQSTTMGSPRSSSTWRRPMCQDGPSSSSIRPNKSGRALSPNTATRWVSAAR